MNISLNILLLCIFLFSKIHGNIHNCPKNRQLIRILENLENKIFVKNPQASILKQHFDVCDEIQVVKRINLLELALQPVPEKTKLKCKFEEQKKILQARQRKQRQMKLYHLRKQKRIRLELKLYINPKIKLLSQQLANLTQEILKDASINAKDKGLIHRTRTQIKNLRNEIERLKLVRQQKLKIQEIHGNWKKKFDLAMKKCRGKIVKVKQKCVPFPFNITLPKIKLPAIKWPKWKNPFKNGKKLELKLPKIRFPKINFKGIHIKFPKIQLPKIKFPKIFGKSGNIFARAGKILKCKADCVRTGGNTKK